MKCSFCNDQRVTWQKDPYGCATCRPCQVCNKKGKAVKKETEEFDKLYHSLLTNQVRGVVNG